MRGNGVLRVAKTLFSGIFDQCFHNMYYSYVRKKRQPTISPPTRSYPNASENQPIRMTQTFQLAVLMRDFGISDSILKFSHNGLTLLLIRWTRYSLYLTLRSRNNATGRNASDQFASTVSQLIQGSIGE